MSGAHCVVVAVVFVDKLKMKLLAEYTKKFAESLLEPVRATAPL